mgnify:CR=1 FL=1
MKVSELLKADFIIPDLKGETKEDVIIELIDLFSGQEFWRLCFLILLECSEDH